MKKRIIIVILLSLLLTACSAATGTTAGSPLAEIRLNEILVEEGDLPEGYTGGGIRNTAPEMFDNLPEAQNQVNQQIVKGVQQKGGVTVFLYDSTEDVERAFERIVMGFGANASRLMNVGEKASAIYLSTTVEDGDITFGDLVFIRCHAVVHIRMADIPDKQPLADYALKLDARLSELVCD